MCENAIIFVFLYNSGQVCLIVFKGMRNFSNSESLKKHDVSEKHQLAVEAEQASKDPEKAPLNRSISRLTREQNEMMLMLFRTAYCVAKHNFSLSSFPVLISLQESNGLRIWHAYKNNKAAISFIASIATVEQESLLEKLNATDFFSLLLDGSTDVSTSEQQIYTRLLVENKPQNCLLGIISLTASNIAEELELFLTETGMVDWKNKLVGLRTDGASINIGVRGGLGAILQKDIPHLIKVHCVTHKLKLAVIDACKKVPYITKFLDTIKDLLRFYSHSSKRLRELSLASKILDDTMRKYGTWNLVRWIASKSRTMEVVDNNWAATIHHLSSVVVASNNQEASTAKGIVRAMTSVKIYIFSWVYV